jgi:hypothetical protein
LWLELPSSLSWASQSRPPVRSPWPCSYDDRRLWPCRVVFCCSWVQLELRCWLWLTWWGGRRVPCWNFPLVACVPATYLLYNYWINAALQNAYLQ